MYNNIALFLGHLIGDYILQNDDMAINKSKPSYEGLLPCIKHCTYYALSVAFCVLGGGWRLIIGQTTYNYQWSLLAAFLIAYITHYPIDRHSLAKKWMKKIGQSTDFEKANEIRKYFIAPVYIAVDNTMHLFLMWLLFSLLG